MNNKKDLCGCAKSYITVNTIKPNEQHSKLERSSRHESTTKIYKKSVKPQLQLQVLARRARCVRAGLLAARILHLHIDLSELSVAPTFSDRSDGREPVDVR
jgi:hypothetical protein